MTATVSTAALISAAADIATEARSVLSALASILDRLAGSAEGDLGDTARQIAQLPSYTNVGIDGPYALFAGALDVLAHAQEATRDGARQDADTVREILDVLASLPLGASLVASENVDGPRACMVCGSRCTGTLCGRTEDGRTGSLCGDCFNARRQQLEEQQPETLVEAPTQPQEPETYPDEALDCPGCGRLVAPAQPCPCTETAAAEWSPDPAVVAAALTCIASPEEPSLTDLEAEMAAQDRRAMESEGGRRAALVDAMDRHAAGSAALEEAAAREEDRQALKPIAEAYKEPAPEESVTTAANPPAAGEPAAPLAPLAPEADKVAAEMGKDAGAAGGPDEDEETEEEDGSVDEDDDLVTEGDIKALGWSDLRILAARLGIAMPRGTTRADVERQVLRHYGLGLPGAVAEGNS